MTSKKSAFGYERHIYHPGDIFEIEESVFREDFMVKMVEPKKPKVIEKPKEEPVEEPESTEETSVVEEVTSNVIAAQVAPKVQKRKKA